MFSKLTSLARRPRILINNPLFRFRNASTNGGGQETNKTMSDRLKKIYDDVLITQGSHMEGLHKFVVTAADEVILDINEKLKIAAKEAASNLNTTGTNLQTQINITKTELNATIVALEQETNKTKRNFKTLYIVSGIAISSIVAFGYFFLFRKYKKMENDFETTKKRMETGTKVLTEAQSETVWDAGYLTSLETEIMEINKNLLKEYNDRMHEYWPRPWPSYRSMYREKIQVIELIQEKIQEKSMLKKRRRLR